MTGLTMTNAYCAEYVEECGAYLDLSDEYCEYHTGGSEQDPDQYWAYPLIVEGEKQSRESPTDGGRSGKCYQGCGPDCVVSLLAK